MRGGERVRVLQSDILANLMGTVILGLAARLQVSLLAIAAVLWIVVKLWAELVVHET